MSEKLEVEDLIGERLVKVGEDKYEIREGGEKWEWKVDIPNPSGDKGDVVPSAYIENHFYKYSDGWRYKDQIIKNVTSVLFTSRKDANFVRKILVPNHALQIIIDVGPVECNGEFFHDNVGYQYDEANKELAIAWDHSKDEV